jgi:CheY-like chemotaxis protein
MNGSLGIASQLGQGTTVTLTLPCRLAEEIDGEAMSPTAAALAESGPTQAGSVLVVEDLPINQELIVGMLARLGHTAQVAANGAEALALLKHHDAGSVHYQLVLMDVQMPVMDGLTATRRIREGHGRSASLPIVALTANAYSADVDACLAAGMNDHLAKPVTVADLRRLTDEWIASSPGEELRLAG